MFAWVLRLFLFLQSLLVAWTLGREPFWIAFTGALTLLIIALEWKIAPSWTRAWWPVAIGLGVGWATTWLFTVTIRYGLDRPLPPGWSLIAVGLFVPLTTLSAYHRRDLLFGLGRSPSERAARPGAAYLLDTSVIIDGRIANVCRAGFIEGRILVPRFVLRELQYIADSSDTLRRNKGRRGLRILNELQENPDLTVEIVEEELPDIDEVDAKLTALAKMLDAKLVTNDYNLKSIAELEGVRVLSLNELAAAVKPEVIQGEIMSVRIIREGKEPGQGVGFLDDGTMVVVEQGKDYLHQKIDVEVTGVLQTSAGRMIFARPREEGRLRR